MSFSSATVSVGGVTRQSEYQRVMDNTVFNKSLTPPGVIYPYAGSSAPDEFLLCDGTSYLRTTYAALFAIIGITFGSVDGTHFNVPDFQGLFLRGAGAHGTLNMADGNDVDGGAVADENVDQMFIHQHSVNGSNSLTTQPTNRFQIAGQAGYPNSNPETDTVTDGGSGTPNTGPETYPSHGVINYIIKT